MYGVVRRGVLIGVAVVALAAAGSAAADVQPPTKPEALKFTRAYIYAYTHRQFRKVCGMASPAYLQNKSVRKCARMAKRNYDPTAKFWKALRSGYTITKSTLTGPNQSFGYPVWTYTMFFKSGRYRASLVVKLVHGPSSQLKYLSVASGSA